MAKQKQPKLVNFKLSRGIRMYGRPIRPFQIKKVGTGKDAKETEIPTIITIRETLAKELASASKGEITAEKPNVKLVEPVVDDELADAFGENED